MIKIVFQNKDDSLDLKYVKSIVWKSETSDDTFVDKSTRVGKRKRSITVNGFINNGIITKNVESQQLLESRLRDIGTGTLEYTGADDIINVRFKSISFDEYRGNPIATFQIEFETEEENIHAHYPVKIGDLILAPTYGYEYPTINEKIDTQGPDEAFVGDKNRSIVIEGSIVQSTRNLINEAQQAILDEIEGETSFILTLSVASNDYSETLIVRPRSINFSSPTLKGDVFARKYRIECSTYEDYTKEPFTLGESSATFGGIEIDVVESIVNKPELEKSSVGTFTLISEELSVSGKRYFEDYDAYDTFRGLFNPFPQGTYTYTSGTSNVLTLVDISIGAFERDGNFADNSKRYRAGINLTFRWQKTIQDISYEALVTRFGVIFYKIPTMSFNAQIDDFGNVTSRSISLNGEIKGDANLSAFKALAGSTISYDAPYTNLVVTSIGISNVNAVNDSGVQDKIYSVNLSANQLETSQQAIQFVRSLFRMDRAGGSGTSYSALGIQFENINNYSKSISNRYNEQQLKFTVTSINVNISGDVFEPDIAGKPGSPNKVKDLLDKIDSLLTAEISIQSTENTPVNGEIFPSNTDIHFLLTNISIGNWQPATAPENLQGGNGLKGARYWKQNVSVSATAVFDLNNSGGSNQPDSVESKSIEYVKESPKFTQIQVANLGTVFKRTGTTPEKATVTYEKRFKDARAYQLNDYGSDDTTPTGWAGIGKSIVTKDTRDQRNLVNRHTVEYTATEQLNP